MFETGVFVGVFVAVGCTYFTSQCAAKKSTGKTLSSARTSKRLPETENPPVENEGKQVPPKNFTRPKNNDGGAAVVPEGGGGGGASGEKAVGSAEGKNRSLEKNSKDSKNSKNSKKSKKSKTSKKKTKSRDDGESQPKGANSTNNPSKPMDGTQGAKTDGQAKADKEMKYISADDIVSFAKTECEFETPCTNFRALDHELIANAREVLFCGNVDDKKVEGEIDSMIKAIENGTGDKEDKNLDPEASKGKKAEVTNKESRLFETREMLTEEEEEKQPENAAGGANEEDKK